MRIDAHHHLWDLAVRDQPWTRDLPALRRTFTAAELRPALDQNAIDATVLVQTIAVAEETPELLAVASADPHVRAVVGWTSLTDPGIADRLARLRELPGGSALVGIRHGIQDEADPDWPERPEVRRGIEAVGAAGLVYDLLVRPDQLPAAVRTVRELPEVRFVLDHAGNPVVGTDGLPPWTKLLTELADCPNVAVKLSGLVTRTAADPARALRPFADVLLATMGPGRLMYGSDWPVCLLAAGYDEVLSVAESLTDHLNFVEREAVFGTTAARWYGIAS
ncbi:amidohydrolase family protein [Streptomyces sp. MI02-2A]|uniref:amidohydrolase family protein n=1 Tax=unclassified Streptomyces TaxID=2593676 RepID=UPI0007413C3A|nr:MULTISPECIES: amidohydrolase family protein [unclassified Streptomyces]KUJ34662.1 amidohydrolase [Streptomyces sp. NRRL F-5122]MDX3262922.1 amidohydrolase family protein [Streptomyces sp. MI02-2A]REE66293.1 L-fuconolactonase [Streptomyces sp. 3212.3]